MLGSATAGRPAAAKTSTPALLAHHGLLAHCADDGVQLAIIVDSCLQKRHAKGAALGANRVLESLWIEGVEHELDAFGGASPERWQHRIHLVRQQGDDDEVVRDMFAQSIGDVHVRTLPVGCHDATVALQLLQSHRARPRDGGDLVMACTSQMEGEGAPYATDADHCNAQCIRHGLRAWPVQEC